MSQTLFLNKNPFWDVCKCSSKRFMWVVFFVDESGSIEVQSTCADSCLRTAASDRRLLASRNVDEAKSP